MNKLKIWNVDEPWEDAESVWESGAEEAAKEMPLRELKVLPNVVGITKETAKNLKWKSLRYMVTHDGDGSVRRGFLKHPLKYGWGLISSAVRSKSYIRDGDFFYYGISSEGEFIDLLRKDNTLLVMGFSYCHKPFECPSGRFTDQCIHDPGHLVCRQCFIGKAINALPAHGCIPLAIPTIHYIGSKIFEIVHTHLDRQIIFLITACEMTLEMFGDWGNMVEIKGVGVRLDGRICNTMKAFELSEVGIKPGLTVVLDETKRRILNLIRERRETDEHG